MKLIEAEVLEMPRVSFLYSMASAGVEEREYAHAGSPGGG
jgi:hypothetical protein